MLELIKISITEGELLRYSQNKEYSINTEVKGADCLTNQEMKELTESIETAISLLLKGLVRSVQ